MNAKQLYQLGENLFTNRQSLTSLWQEIGDNFYPERAEFTLKRDIGDRFSEDIMSSYPILVRRGLGNQFTTMLRPTAKPWFHPKVRYLDDPDNETKVVLERMEETQRRAMYDPRAKFNRASKEGDHDLAAFGQCVKSVELNNAGDGIIYRCWHLRDVAWQEDESGEIGFVFRKWKPTVQQAISVFPGKLDQKVVDRLAKEPFADVHLIHMVVTSDMYDNKTAKPRWSIWYDIENDHIIEETPIHGKHYIIPRWQTVSGSQYSYSPATIAGLPDARLLQAMTFTLLEAGEKATSPPMVATQGVVRSDMAVYAGGVTWVDQDYDERLGDALKPIAQDLRGLQFGGSLNEGAMAMLNKAFYMDTLTMPPMVQEMTAFEVGKRVEEYIRNALPIFEPIEEEDNAAICDETFGLLQRNGAFGDPRSWPQALQGADIDFVFESPLHDAIDQQDATKFREANALISEAMALDPSLGHIPKAEVALRDALTGLGVKSSWMKSEAEVEDARNNDKAQQEATQKLSMMQQGADVAETLQGAQGA